ncbi:hypothetical protein OQA88_11723 [Cercophora sp. LCS_1]
MSRPNHQSYRTTLLDDAAYYDSDDEYKLDKIRRHDDSVTFDDDSCISVDKRTSSTGSTPELRNHLLAVSNPMLTPERINDEYFDNSYFGNLFTSLEDIHGAALVHVPPSPEEEPRQSKPKRRLSSISQDTIRIPDAVKRLRRTSTATRSLRKTPTDDWFFVTDLSDIPTYGPSDVMSQQRFTRRAVLAALAAPTKMASKTMGKIKRRCSGALLRRPSTPVYKPVKCVATGMAY